MREIKFRAWEKHAKRMAEVTEIKWKPDYLYHSVNTSSTVNGKKIDEWYAHDFNGDSNGIIIMQYTGLKDKNGVEIYEGDILQYPNTKETYGIVIWDIESARFMSDWPYWGGFTPMCNCGKCESDCCVEVAEVQIIGNRHDNPELLEVTG